jgi:hypothetical protein
MPAEELRAAPLSPIVIRLGSFGDMLKLSALLHFLHRRYGRPCVVVGSGPWNQPVYLDNPDVEPVRVLHRYLPFLLSPGCWRRCAAAGRRRFTCATTTSGCGGCSACCASAGLIGAAACSSAMRPRARVSTTSIT